MTTFLLVRHASHDWLGKRLAGRSPGVHLNQSGQLEAAGLAARLGVLPIDAIYCGPLERALETAAPIARRFGMEPHVTPALDEIHFGEWTGCTFDKLDSRADWKQWNNKRAASLPPGGESMRSVQERIVNELWRLNGKHGAGHVVLISHGDVIKSALMAVLQLSLDEILRFEVSPASVSTVVLGRAGSQVRLINDLGSLVG